MDPAICTPQAQRGLRAFEAPLAEEETEAGELSRLPTTTGGDEPPPPAPRPPGLGGVPRPLGRLCAGRALSRQSHAPRLPSGARGGPESAQGVGRSAAANRGARGRRASQGPSPIGHLPLRHILGRPAWSARVVAGAEPCADTAAQVSGPAAQV